jgi:hypothetical protein
MRKPLMTLSTRRKTLRPRTAWKVVGFPGVGRKSPEANQRREDCAFMMLGLIHRAPAMSVAGLFVPPRYGFSKGPMELDLQNELAALPPWNFTVKIGSKVYPTKQPTLADHETIRTIDRMKDDEAFEFIYSLFAEPRPPKSSLTRDSLRIVLVNVIAHGVLRGMPVYHAAKDRAIKREKDNAAIAKAASAALPSPLN